MAGLWIVGGGATIDLTTWPVRVDGPLRFPAPVSKHVAAARAGIRVPLEDELAVRVIPVEVNAATIAAAEDAFIALKVAAESHRASLRWQSRDGGPIISTTIRAAQVTEEQTATLDRSIGSILATLALTTDAEWTGTEEAITTDTITVNKGDRPARMRLKLTSSSANPLIGLGIKHAPSADYDPHEVIGSPAAVTLNAGYIDLHAPAAIDTHAHRGSHVLAAKVATTNAATRYRAKVVTAGSGIALSATATHDSVLALATAARWQVLPGPVSIPAGGVPGIETGSGYTAEAVQTGNTVNDGTLTLTAGDTGAGEYIVGLNQTFPGFNGLSTAIEYTIDAEASAVLTRANVLVNELYVGGAPISIPTTVGTHKVVVPSNNMREGATFRALFSFVSVSPFTIGLAHSNGDYLDGALTQILGTGVSTGDDLTFNVYGQVPLGFDSTVIVQGANSTGTGTLSSATLIPADDFAAAWDETFGANQGVLIENTDPLSPPAVYITTSTAGTAGPALAASMWHGTPRLRPGVNKVVTACDGTLTISGVWMPCYSNAAAGSL